MRMKMKTALTLSLAVNAVLLAAVGYIMSLDENLVSTPVIVYPQSAVAAWPLKDVPAPETDQASLSK